MKIYEYIEHYIPGYKFLTHRQKADFLRSDLFKKIQKYQADKENSLIAILYDYINFGFYEEIMDDPAYKLILTQIDANINHQRQLMRHIIIEVQFESIINLNLNIKFLNAYVEYILCRSIKFDLDQYLKLLSDQINSQTLLTSSKWALPSKSLSKTIEDYLNAIIESDSTQTARNFGDTHIFHQLLGITSESGYEQHGWLDLINYWRSIKTVSEIRKIFSTLLLPLSYLAREYKDIAKEKNPFIIVFRAIVPLLIIGAIVGAAALLLSPFGLPEIVIILLLIPILYFACAITSGILASRDSLYIALKPLAYGGTYNMPEFQVKHNPRILEAFGGLEPATSVRDFYVELLKECDANEHQYAAKKNRLTQDEIQSRRENSAKKSALRQEWRAIYANIEIGIDQLPYLVAKRIYTESESIFPKLIQATKEYLIKFEQEIKHPNQEEIVPPEVYISPVVAATWFKSKCNKQAKNIQLPRDKINELSALSEQLENANSKADRIYPPIRKF